MMTRIEELSRKATLHRQGGALLREEAKRHDRAATMIDGELSEAESKELAQSFRTLLLIIEKATLETRLARLGV